MLDGWGPSQPIPMIRPLDWQCLRHWRVFQRRCDDIHLFCRRILVGAIDKHDPMVFVDRVSRHGLLCCFPNWFSMRNVIVSASINHYDFYADFYNTHTHQIKSSQEAISVVWKQSWNRWSQVCLKNKQRCCIPRSCSGWHSRATLLILITS